ncbi:potassium-transporting ATPase subunit C [Streptomyces albipurpureus]|uniref:Potassium-transporting ATPase KdpC subunit n=1 Tax=Streptomyces albipurpureus TaxID=2897419 RepID=A0ABT0UEU9_9ACTN|nr:potassium-transporting ATPase subunit C [Streptomyces sp. CWNU-1]MCM2386868.1 potassium-transporting ATPase subunit C [Streptomyces sp. CWNU-1]
MNTSLRNTGRLITAAVRTLLVLTVVCGVLYPLAVTGAAQALFPGKANGSEVKADGKVVGSSLIGQSYSLPKENPDDADEAARADLRWFQPRPSNGLGSNSVNTQYALILSGATNRSGDNAELIQWVKDAKAAVVKDNSTATHQVKPSQVPVDAVTSSGSGLDPHISPEYAELQVHRVAERNALPVGKVDKLLEEHTDGRILGFIGEPRVNVLQLNIGLKELMSRPTS